MRQWKPPRKRTISHQNYYKPVGEGELRVREVPPELSAMIRAYKNKVKADTGEKINMRDALVEMVDFAFSEFCGRFLRIEVKTNDNDTEL